MIIETKRLRLRPWMENDAESLYELAKDPQVGPNAGWPVHTSVENSRQIIKEILSAKESYAITLKNKKEVIGAIGLVIGKKSRITNGENEAEVGYWLGVPYWGQGIVPEALRELMRYAFEELGLTTLWCGYYERNEKSKRVQEKCGFSYHHTITDVKVPVRDTTLTEHISCVTKEQWITNHEILG